MNRLAIFICCLLTLAPMVSANGQSYYDSSGSMQETPLMTPRPLGDELEIQNLRARPLDDSESIGSFVESVQGEDSSINVIVGRGRLLTLKEPLTTGDEKSIPVVAVGDPTVVDIDILPDPRIIRLLGKRIGVTDLSVVTASGKAYSFVIHVTYDMNFLRAYMQQIYPDADLRITSMNEHLVIEGQARNTAQSEQIYQTLSAYVSTAQLPRTVKSSDTGRGGLPDLSGADDGSGNGVGGEGGTEPLAIRGDVGAGLAADDKPDITATLGRPQIINLIRVPGVQQIMLQVRIAELNRTAFRQMGSDLFIRDSSGNSVGTNIGGAVSTLAGLGLGQSSTGFAIFPSGEVDLVMSALRKNQVLSILAEPNLVAMHGQEASFLAGGEFPVPVPQGLNSGGGGAITIQYKKFGVQLNFVPYLLDDETIRLHVAPEVSTIDNTIGTTTGGTSVPGINTRRVKTTVELRQGQTLAVAGLLQVSLEGGTARIPGIGEVPYLGSFFSNTSHQRVEKELLVLVTPYFVDGMNESQVPALPGSEIRDPTDRELYGYQRIEGLTGENYRATSGWNDPTGIGRRIEFESGNFYGPYGFSR